MYGRSSMLLVLLQVICAQGVLSCKMMCDYLEVSVPEEKELEKYPYLKAFVVNSQDFQGIRHKIDTGEYSFRFLIAEDFLNTYFGTIDERVNKLNWKLHCSNEATRLYVREPKKAYLARYQIVQLDINTQTRWITLEYDDHDILPGKDKCRFK